MSQTPNTEKRKFHWKKLVLPVSLGLNLLVVGIVGGAILNHGDFDHKDKRSPHSALVEFGPYTRALSPKDQDALRNQLKPDLDRLRDARREFRNDFKDLLNIVRADSFDRAAAADVIDRQKTRLDEQSALARDLLLDRLEEMSAAERDAFADRLEKVLRKGPPRSKPDGDKDAR